MPVPNQARAVLNTSAERVRTLTGTHPEQRGLAFFPEKAWEGDSKTQIGEQRIEWK
jgi:hypothetical protein